MTLSNLRIGFGYDIHLFSEKRKLILGGIEIPHHLGLLGHSDADALVHSIIDAILGAAGLGDIGTHFPDSDNTYKNISSIILLKKTINLVKRHNFCIINIDSTIICEHPKIAPYRQSIIQNLSKIIGIPIDRISIKAATKEKCDATGEGKALECYSVALLEYTPNLNKQILK